MAQPEKTYKKGAVTASIFENTTTINGTSKKIKNAVIQRRYKDRNGQWQSTNSFGMNDLPKVAMLAQKAYDYITSEESL